MNGDLRLFRRRWWGIYPIAVFIVPGIPLCLLIGIAQQGPAHPAALPVAAGCAAVLALALLVLYAPWTFHWAGRALGGLVGLGYLAYLASEIAAGHWFSAGRSGTSAFNALLGLLAIGVPSFLVMRSRRHPVCPYDEAGRHVGSSQLHTIELDLPPGSPVEEVDTRVAAAVAAVVALRLPWVEAAEHFDEESPAPRLDIAVPRGEAGREPWQAVMAGLAQQGIAFREVTDGAAST